MKNIKSFCCLSALALAWACSFAQAATRTSSQSGNWSATSTWGGSAVPGSADLAVIANGHTVTYDVTTTTVAGVTINAGGTLEFTPGTSRTLQSSKNVEVQGTLKMRPSSASVIHTLKFMGIVESNFVGGGDVVLASDVGLWVMGAGKLDIVGTAKTAWARASGAIASDATSVTLGTTPSGWAVGDEISITPTEAPVINAKEKLANPTLYTGFEDKTLTSVSGATVGWSGGLTLAHPMVNGQWTAEVLNLTRNVRIEGTVTGRSHIFIRTTVPTIQTLSYADIRYMGPVFTGPNPAEPTATGRYGIHVHDCGDTSRGSVFTGTVIRDTGNHAFVPHLSHGTTFINCIAYNTTLSAYWWDNNTPGGPDNFSIDTLYDGCVAAKIMDLPSNDNGVQGFSLEKGAGNVVKNCVAVGNHDGDVASGFNWPGGEAQVWGFSENNISHNNKSHGIYAWQNSPNDHVLENFVCYHNGNFGVTHGAYKNHYVYNNATLYGNGKGAIDLHAVSQGDTIANGQSIIFENVILDGAGISKSLVVTNGHTQSQMVVRTIFRNCTFQGHTQQAMLLQSAPDNKPDLIDFVCCTIDANEFWLASTASINTSIRVQPDNTTAFELKRAGASGGTLIPAWNAKKYTISPFTTCP